MGGSRAARSIADSIRCTSRAATEERAARPRRRVKFGESTVSTGAPAAEPAPFVPKRKLSLIGPPKEKKIKGTAVVRGVARCEIGEPR